jgi:hypothetical protein
MVCYVVKLYRALNTQRKKKVCSDVGKELDIIGYLVCSSYLAR